jgi:Phage Tail Collar Domain/Collagen triple helix repeat (20 copies)
MRSRVLALLRQQPIALLALFVALGGTSFAAVHSSAKSPASDDVIHGCVGKNTGRLRIVDSPTRCGSLETPISFNREGRPGPQGPAGKRGLAGAKGDAGAAGAKGDTGANGAGGRDGVDGHDGANGHDGADGHDGLDALTATAAEPAGANCAAGGIKVTAGQDANRNGALDPAEVDPAITRYVCHGAAGASNADTLDGLDSSASVTTSGFGSRFTDALGQKFFSGTRATTFNSSGGNDDWLGQIFLTAANFPPPGTAFAAGQLLPISQNTAVFSLLGTTYGGDGRTTFALPDLRDEAPAGTNYVITLNGLYPARP